MADILIAEDDEVLRNLYRKKLSMRGHVVREAKDGDQATSMIKERAPDLLILDIRMPRTDGLQVLREFPKRDRTFPIVVVSNFYDSQLKDEAVALGADQYRVKKDTTMKDLLELSEEMLRGDA